MVAVREQEPGHYTKILFDLMDVNKDTVIDFNEWVRVLGTYCMFTFEDLLQFVFVSFDSDGDGFLGKYDLFWPFRLFYSSFIPLRISIFLYLITGRKSGFEELDSFGRC